MLKRIKYVDIAKGIGILFVLLGHIIPDKSLLKSLIYTFHMPLFFFVHGIVAQPKPMKTFLARRGRTLLVPYFFWGIAFTGIKISEKLLLLIWGTGEALHIVKTNGMLWFLATMFVASLLTNIVLLLSQKIYNNRGRFFFKLIMCILLLALSMIVNRFHKVFKYNDSALGLLFSFDVSLLAASMITAGHVFGIILGRLENKSEKQGKDVFRSIGILITALLLFFAAVYIGYTANRNVGNYPTMQIYRLGNVPVYWITALVASGCIAAISKWISVHIKKTGWIVWLGENSLALFIMHGTIRSLIRDFLSSHSSLKMYFCSFVFIIVYSCLCTCIVNRYIPAMVGKTDIGQLHNSQNSSMDSDQLKKVDEHE